MSPGALPPRRRLYEGPNAEEGPQPVSDEPRVQVEGDSEPAVALALLQLIMKAQDGATKVDRDWILSTYADCLAVVGGAEVEFDDEDDEDEGTAGKG